MIRRTTLGIALAGVLISAAAVAEEPAGGSPEPSTDTEVAASEEASTPDASVGNARSWLRQPKAQAGNSQGSDTGSGGWPIAACVLLAALGGAAIYMKYRRSAPSFLLPPSDVRVVSTTRIGTKASLIVAEVHGRMMLLGVTEQSVSELGWLDEGTEPGNTTGEPEHARPREEYPATRGVSRFGEALSNSMARDERDTPFRGNPNVAALIAASAPGDVVHTRRTTTRGESRTSVRAAAADGYQRVEDQVAGLARRRR